MELLNQKPDHHEVDAKIQNTLETHLNKMTEQQSPRFFKNIVEHLGNMNGYDDTELHERLEEIENKPCQLELHNRLEIVENRTE